MNSHLQYNREKFAANLPANVQHLGYFLRFPHRDRQPVEHGMGCQRIDSDLLHQLGAEEDKPREKKEKRIKKGRHTVDGKCIILHEPTPRKEWLPRTYDIKTMHNPVTTVTPIPIPKNPNAVVEHDHGPEFWKRKVADRQRRWDAADDRSALVSADIADQDELEIRVSRRDSKTTATALLSRTTNTSITSIYAAKPVPPRLPSPNLSGSTLSPPPAPTTSTFPYPLPLAKDDDISDLDLDLESCLPVTRRRDYGTWRSSRRKEERERARDEVETRSGILALIWLLLVLGFVVIVLACGLGLGFGRR